MMIWNFAFIRILDGGGDREIENCLRIFFDGFISG